ncbi:MAG: hypothetical protein HZB33_01955 [Nitrospirae bacterium]|nr:hypothetical protein [Nitrospirota bacterium]
MQAVEREELKEIMREVIREEMLTLALNLIPYVSDEEQKGMEAMAIDQSGDFVSGMSWLGR